MVEEKKVKRNHRMLYISEYLVSHPNELISLSRFVNYFNCAKSSISEDVDFIRDVFDTNGLGEIKTIAGVTGGVIFYPTVRPEEVNHLFQLMRDILKKGKRILPGNYIYVSDLLSEPSTLNLIAKIIATHYQKRPVDAVMTVETKGIGLCVAVARYLNVPYVVVRRDSDDSEGSTISINYVSGSHQTVKKMALSKLSLKENSKVLIVDDFLRNGGTVEGMLSILEEFNCEKAGVCVFAENADQHGKQQPYNSIIKIEIVFNKALGHYELKLSPGSFFSQEERQWIQLEENALTQ